MTNRISFRIFFGIIGSLLFCQNGFGLPLVIQPKAQRHDLGHIESKQLADGLSSELGSDRYQQLLIQAFERIKEIQESQITPINISTGDSGFIVCAGINVGMAIISGEGAICSDLSGRIYELSYAGTGPALNATSNILIGYVQSLNLDLSGKFGGRNGYFDNRFQGSIGGAWLLLGARAIYFPGESKSYIGLVGWEFGAGAGVTSDARIDLNRVK